MKTLATVLLLAAIMPASDPKNFYDYSVKSIDGEDVQLSQYEGKVVMIVNVASNCGFTPQYEELQELYVTKKDEGFVILGFPSNDFGGQEPGTESEIKAFCSANYGVTFPMFSKVAVKGNNTAPVYNFLTQKALNGYQDVEVSWNFQKFLIDRHGKLREVYPPAKSPSDGEVINRIDQLLAEK